MQTTSLFAFTLLCFAVLGARSAPNASSSSLRHLSNGSKLGGQVGNPTFMVTNGVTASSELCLTVEGGLVDSDGAEIVLMPCASAIAAGDGRELFSLQPNGQLLSAVGEMCVGPLGSEVADGGEVVLMRCRRAALLSNAAWFGNGCALIRQRVWLSGATRRTRGAIAAVCSSFGGMVKSSLVKMGSSV